MFSGVGIACRLIQAQKKGREGRGREFEFFGDCHARVAWISRHHQHQQPLAVGGGGGCRGTTDVLMIFLQPSLSSASLRVLARGSSVHSLMLSCQHFFFFFWSASSPPARYCALHDGVCKSCCSCNMSIPSQFPGLDYREEVIVWSNGRPDSVPDVFVCDSVSE